MLALGMLPYGFYVAALNIGGQDKGSLGLQNYVAHYYGAYIHSVDGNKR